MRTSSFAARINSSILWQCHNARAHAPRAMADGSSPQPTESRSKRRSAVTDGSPGAIHGDTLCGRPDLAEDSIQNPRLRQRSLKQEAAKLQRDLKNKKRQKQRIMRKVSRLATSDIVQALLDRGVELQRKPSEEPENTPGAASSGADRSLLPAPVQEPVAQALEEVRDDVNVPLALTDQTLVVPTGVPGS